MRKMAFFGRRGDPLKKRILTHHAPAFSASVVIRPTIALLILQGDCNRVKCRFLPIVGGFYQSWARGAIIGLIVR